MNVGFGSIGTATEHIGATVCAEVGRSRSGGRQEVLDFVIDESEKSEKSEGSPLLEDDLHSQNRFLCGNRFAKT